MPQQSFIQVGNWRTPEVQVVESDGTATGTQPIDLTGATGFFIWMDELGNTYQVEINLGRAPANSTDAAAEAIDGWCWATFTGIDVPGEWKEQLQAVLPGDDEPINAGVVSFNVSANLTPPEEE